MVNSPTWSTAGEIGGCISLANSNQQVDVADTTANPPAHPVDGQTNMTFSFWFKVASFDTDGSYREILYKNGAYNFALRNTSLYTTVGTLQENPVVIAANQWYHVAVVYKGYNATTQPTNNQQTYINGVPVSYTNATAITVARKAGNPLLIGAVSTTDTHAFNGQIDEVRIYTRALSLSEIQALAAAAPSNLGPVITTNTSLSGIVPLPLALTAMVTDDGNPAGGSLTYNWSQVSGPATLTIPNPTSISTTTTPAVAGSYGLQFTASDGAITTVANIGATIATETYASWATSYGLPTNTPNAILQSDGLTNLFKYALGLNHTLYTSREPPVYLSCNSKSSKVPKP